MTGAVSSSTANLASGGGVHPSCATFIHVAHTDHTLIFCYSGEPHGAGRWLPPLSFAGLAGLEGVAARAAMTWVVAARVVAAREVPWIGGVVGRR